MVKGPKRSLDSWLFRLFFGRDKFSVGRFGGHRRSVEGDVGNRTGDIHKKHRVIGITDQDVAYLKFWCFGL